MEIAGADAGEATDSSQQDSSPGPETVAALRAQGRERLKANDFANAVALLARAVTAEPRDGQTQLELGIALQGASRHEQALKCFVSAQKLLPDDAAPFLHAAVSLLHLKQPQEALRAASEACHRAPQLAQAHYAYGQAWFALNEAAKAERAFAEAVRLSPNWPDAWINYGIARYRQGAIEDAKGAMRRALAIAPDHLAAAVNLGVFMRLSGEIEAAENLLDGLLARNPDAAEVRVNRAATLLSEERPAEALALLDAAPVPREPRVAQHWQMQRALALLQVGRMAEARHIIDEIGEVPEEFAPLLLWRRTLLAQAQRDPSAAQAHALEMERALAATDRLVPEHRIMAHYDLARFWSGHREPDRAFNHWAAGHRLLGRFQPFSREQHRAFVDGMIAAFDDARLHHGPRAQNRDQAPVFIVGMPRSGTTLAEQIIAAHPQAFGAGERNALHDTFGKLGGERPQGAARIAALDAANLDALADRYLADLHALAPGKARIVDKLPGNFNYLGLVGLMLPGARIIHCVRDPRDIGLSIFTYRFYGNHPYAHDLGDLGWYISEHDRIMAHWRDTFRNPILTLALKDWVEDFDGTLRRVLDFIDLPYDPACERFYESDARVLTVSRSQVRQPVNARGLGRWRAYAAQLKPLIDALEEGGVTLPPLELSAPARRGSGQDSALVEGAAEMRRVKLTNQSAGTATLG